MQFQYICLITFHVAKMEMTHTEKEQFRHNWTLRGLKILLTAHIPHFTHPPKASMAEFHSKSPCVAYGNIETKDSVIYLMPFLLASLLSSFSVPSWTKSGAVREGKQLIYNNIYI